MRVQIYNAITRLVIKNISTFQDFAYGATFRRDGRLLVAGDEGGFVRLFDISRKNILRLFKGHRAPVHRTFFASDNIHIASFSDDKSVKYWDIPSEKVVHTFYEHQDYIRAGCVSPIYSNILLSGGYDNKLKLYDVRTASSVMQMNHGNPVESVIFLPSGGIVLSAGGTDIKVWDTFNGGKLLAKITQHHKTVTCLRMASNGKRLMSSGLDHHINVYDIATYEKVHNFDYSNAVLSVGIAPKNEILVAGLVNGLISMQRMENTESQQKTEKTNETTLTTANEVIGDYSRKAEAKYDKWLRKYEYTKALDEVLLPYVVNKSPHITVGLVQELIRRKGLERAFAGRTHKSISIILSFFLRYISDQRFTRTIIDAANVLLNVYEDNFKQFSGDIGQKFLLFLKRLRKEEELTNDFLKIHGAIDLLILNSSAADEIQPNPIDIENEIIELEPSELAKQTFINTIK